MQNSMIVRVIDQSTGEMVASSEVRLYKIGVPGERCPVRSHDGTFSFDGLPEGNYKLAVYSPRHVTLYENVSLASDNTNIIKVQLSPGGFLSGQIVDEEGAPPKRCQFSLIRPGEWKGKFGYVDDAGDHEVSEDGRFCSPPLRPARYFLRFAGFLRKAASAKSSAPVVSAVDRYFEFLYPNAHVLARAESFEVRAGETRSGLRLVVPRPTWHRIRGNVIGDLPGVCANTQVVFSRDFGTIDGIGGSAGIPVQADGSFEDKRHPGLYTAELTELSSPDVDGRVHLVRRLEGAKLDLTHGNLDEVGIHYQPIATNEYPSYSSTQTNSAMI